jgi:hypothetical protein
MRNPGSGIGWLSWRLACPRTRPKASQNRMPPPKLPAPRAAPLQSPRRLPGLRQTRLGSLTSRACLWGQVRRTQTPHRMTQNRPAQAAPVGIRAAAHPDPAAPPARRRVPQSPSTAAAYRPSLFPLGSVNSAYHPISPMAVFGTMTAPPFSCTAVRAASMSSLAR